MQITQKMSLANLVFYFSNKPVISNFLFLSSSIIYLLSHKCCHMNEFNQRMINSPSFRLLSFPLIFPTIFEANDPRQQYRSTGDDEISLILRRGRERHPLSEGNTLSSRHHVDAHACVCSRWLSLIFERRTRGSVKPLRKTAFCPKNISSIMSLN